MSRPARRPVRRVRRVYRLTPHVRARLSTNPPYPPYPPLRRRVPEGRRFLSGTVRPGGWRGNLQTLRTLRTYDAEKIRDLVSDAASKLSECLSLDEKTRNAKGGAS
jgi:hypothetical protein